LLLRVEEEVNGEVDLRPPLDSSTIHWRPPDDGIVLLELFGGLGSSLVAVLQARLKVKRYIYVDVDEAARQVAKQHSQRLKIQFPELLATSAIKTSFSTLVGDIALVSAEDIYRCGHVDLVIAGWPCHDMSMAGKQNGLQDGRSSRFHDMIRVMRYLQTSQR
jgi:site-specific DNA-cytosine methylase